MSTREKVRTLSETALLAAVIGITGSFRIPGLFPGSEFQLSAPIAVALCGVFGFKVYITAGLLASAVSLMLGLQTILSVAVAMTFRLTVGAVWLLWKDHRAFYILAGPAGTAMARVVMYLILGKGLIPMLAAAVPGMFLTACTAWFFAKLLKRVCQERQGIPAKIKSF